MTAVAKQNFDVDPIPADFFDPGSDPFTGTIVWKGEPIDEFQGFALPTPSPSQPENQVDTIMFRPEDAVLSGPGLSTTIPVKMVALSFITEHPITVTYNGGSLSELWDVQAIAPSNPEGSMTIRQTSSDGGTFDTEFPVHPIFIFTRQADGAKTTLDLVAEGFQPIIMTGTDIPWVFERVDPAPTPNHLVTRVPEFTTNFIPGYATDVGRVVSCGTTFVPTARFDQPRGEHGHFASSPTPVRFFDENSCAAAQIPAVSEWGLVIMTLLGMTVGAIFFGRQRTTSPMKSAE